MRFCLQKGRWGLGIALLSMGLVIASPAFADDDDKIDLAIKGTVPTKVSDGNDVKIPEMDFGADGDYIDEDVVERPDSIEGELSSTWYIDETSLSFVLNLIEEPYFVDVYQRDKRQFLAFVKIIDRDEKSVTVMPYDPETKVDLDTMSMIFTSTPFPSGIQKGTIEISTSEPSKITQNGLLKYSQIEHVKQTATQHVLQQE